MSPKAMPNTYDYQSEFFDYLDRGSRRSAIKVVALVSGKLKPTSLIDVGCGRGIWVNEWMKAGVRDCVGVDGSYIDPNKLAIPKECFIARDLSKPFHLDRVFDIVQSLEVAEHINAASADVFVDNLCRLGQLILFSAAIPGQGGETHINEQPLEYWADKFRARGYLAYDWIRPRIARISEIEPWYRYNTLLFVTEQASAHLPADVRLTMLQPGMSIRNIAPLSWRLRNAALRCLPSDTVHKLAIIKHKMQNLLNR